MIGRRGFLGMLAAVPLATRLPLIAKHLPIAPPVLAAPAFIASGMAHDFIPGIRRMGEMSFTMNYLEPGLIDTLMQNEAVPVQLDLPDGTTMALTGIVTSVNHSAPIDGLEELEVSIQPTGPMTLNDRPCLPYRHTGARPALISVNGMVCELTEIHPPQMTVTEIDARSYHEGEPYVGGPVTGDLGRTDDDWDDWDE